MGDAALVFPHQLYRHHPAIGKGRRIFLIEDPLYFTQFPFHKQKLLLHRASMKTYAGHLGELGYEVEYIQVTEYPDMAAVFGLLCSQGVSSLHITDPTDFLLKKRLIRNAANAGMTVTWTESPNFLTPVNQFEELAEPSKGYFMARFYANQRKRLNILIDGDQNPTGGKWSFDTENRKRVPKREAIPPLKKLVYDSAILEEAKIYVETYFADNYGDTNAFNFPVSFDHADAWLHEFISSRLYKFGDYEDAIRQLHPWLWHSVLTPALNIGLLSPADIIDAVLSAHSDNPVPLNSLEGFIRQVIGWREYMRMLYIREGIKMRNSNELDHRRQLGQPFWRGTTGMAPFDRLVKQLHHIAYSHHIERLMVAGNLMLLTETDPHEVYKWFMTFYIDAYDWVMVPNVYSMSQFADAGSTTTKPYISGSAYLIKMSDYRPGDWSRVWDGLYWAFLDRNRERFQDNPRMAMMIRLLNKMDSRKLKAHYEQASRFFGGANIGPDALELF